MPFSALALPRLALVYLIPLRASIACPLLSLRKSMTVSLSWVSNSWDNLTCLSMVSASWRLTGDLSIKFLIIAWVSSPIAAILFSARLIMLVLLVRGFTLLDSAAASFPNLCRRSKSLPKNFWPLAIASLAVLGVGILGRPCPMGTTFDFWGFWGAVGAFAGVGASSVGLATRRRNSAANLRLKGFVVPTFLSAKIWLASFNSESVNDRNAPSTSVAWLILLAIACNGVCSLGFSVALGLLLSLRFLSANNPRFNSRVPPFFARLVIAWFNSLSESAISFWLKVLALVKRFLRGRSTK